MKTLPIWHPTFVAFSHLQLNLKCKLGTFPAFALLFLLGIGTGFADTLVYSTGSSAATTIAALADGDTVVVSGSTGTVTLSATSALAPDGTLAVSSWAQQDATFLLGSKNNITFRPAASASAGWALFQSPGTVHFSLTSGTLNLDKLILTGGTSRSLLVTSDLVIGGDVVFYKNRLDATSSSGGAIRAEASITFAGNAIFDQNLSGWRGSGSFQNATMHGGAIISIKENSTLHFSGTTLFTSNTAAGSGGAIYTETAGTKIIFDAPAVFLNNYAGARATGAGSGGAIIATILTSAGTVSFLDSVLFDGNTAGSNGGAIYQDRYSYFTFAGDVTFSNNHANGNGGGFAAQAGASGFHNETVRITPGAAHAVTLVGNTAGANGGAISNIVTGGTIVINAGQIVASHNVATGTYGGAIYSADAVAITGAFLFSSNTASYAGGAITAANVALVGSGTFTDNHGGTFGGAIFLTSTDNTQARSLAISATGGDIVFTGNHAGTSNSPTAVMFRDGPTNGSSLALDAEAGSAILFLDRIYFASGKYLSVTKNGEGAIIFDRYYQEVAANTAVNGGIFAVTNSATWSRVTTNSLVLGASGTLAGDGVIAAGTMTLAAGSHLQAWNSGTLELAATTRNFGNNLSFSGDGLVNAGATLDAVFISGGTTHAGSLADTGTLILADSVTLAAGGTLAIDLASVGADLIRVQGNLTLAGAATIDLGLLATGSFNIVQWDGIGISSTTGLALTLAGAALTPRTDASLGLDAAAKTLYVTNTTFGLSLRWTGADAVSGTAFWSDASAAHANFADLTTGPGAGTETHFRAGDSVLFANAAAATVHVDSASVTASELVIDNTGALIFAGSGAITIDSASAPGHFRAATTSTTGKLIKNGTGAATIANTATNTFRSGLDVNAGILTLDNPANKIPGGVTLAGGTLAISTAAQLDTTGAAVTFHDGGNLLISQSIAESAALTNTFNFAAAASGIINIADTVAFDGTLAGTGTLVKTGAGTLRILSATDASAFAGATRVDAGSFLLASGVTLGGPVTVSSNALVGGAGTFSGNITVSSGGILAPGSDSVAGATLTVGGNLVMSGTAAMQFNIYPGSNDQLFLSSGTGALTAAASNIVNITGDIQSGTYLLGNAVKLADAGAILKINGNTVTPTLRFTGVLGTTADGDTLLFTYNADSSRYMRWSLTGSDIWNTTLDNWADYDGGVSAPVAGKTKFQDRDSVRIVTAADATLAIPGAVIVSDLLIENTSGTLTLSGAAITTGTAVNGTIIVAPSAKLTKTGSGALVLANTANAFIGGVEINAGLVAISNAAQLGTAGAGINFTGDSTLRTLASLMLSDTLLLTRGVTATLDTETNTVILSGELAGGGVLAKVGNGTLVYQNLILAPAASDAASLVTRIDSGVVQLRAIADPASFAHTVILNGGWLDLSDPAESAFTGAGALVDSANDWAALTILSTASGAAGGIIGANDVVTLGAGEINFAIGGATAQQNGLYVRIAAGSGTTTFTTANTYAGRTIIESGVLAVTADNQLGDTSLARDIILNGGTLAINASLDSARQLELGGGGGCIMVAKNVSATLAGSAGGAPSSVLKIAGIGVLTLAAPLAHAGETTVTGGILRAPGEFLPGLVSLAETAKLELTQQADGVFTGTFTAASGSGGVVTKTGSATLALNPGSAIAAREIHVDSGVLALTSAARLSAATIFRIVSGAQLRGTGTISLAPGARMLNHGEIRVGHTSGASGYGRLTIDGDYEGSGVLHLAVGPLDTNGVVADQFVVTGAATGTTLVCFQQDSAQPALPAGYSLPDDIITFAGATPAAFTQDGPGLIYGGTEYTWQQVSATSGAWRAAIATEVDAATGADAAAFLASKAAATSLAGRLAALRFTPHKTGFAVWADAFHRHDKLRGSIYNEATSSLYGIQVGADYRIGSDVRSLGTIIPTLTAGIFTDYATSDFDQPDAARITASAENHAFGAYVMLQQGLWHVEILTRASEEDYFVNPASTPGFHIKGNGTLQRISAGLVICETRDWHMESQISLTRQRVKLDTATSPVGITYAFDTTESLEAAAAVKFWQDLEWRKDLHIRPSVGGAFLYDFKGCSAFSANNQPFAAKFGGAAGQMDASCVMQVSRSFEAAAALSYLFGSKIESYSITLSLSRRW